MPCNTQISARLNKFHLLNFEKIRKNFFFSLTTKFQIRQIQLEAGEGKGDRMQYV